MLGVSSGFKPRPIPESVGGEASRRVRHDREMVRVGGSSMTAGGTLSLNRRSVCQAPRWPVLCYQGWLTVSARADMFAGREGVPDRPVFVLVRVKARSAPLGTSTVQLILFGSRDFPWGVVELR